VDCASLALQVAPVSYYCLNFFIGLRPKLGNTYYHITEEGHTIQWSKENQQRTNNDLQNSGVGQLPNTSHNPDVSGVGVAPYFPQPRMLVVLVLPHTSHNPGF
jgi:hypothetical protein